MIPPVTRANRITFSVPTMFSKDAVNLVTAGIYYGEGEDKWTPRTFITASTGNSHGENNYDVDVEHFCVPVVHPITGETITQYRKLKDDKATKDVWNTAFGKEFGNMAQGDKKTGTKGTNSMFVLSHDKIRTIPADRTVTYARIVVDYRPQKADPNMVRITAGGISSITQVNSPQDL